MEADPTRAGWAVQHARDNEVSVELIKGTAAQIQARLLGGQGDAELLDRGLSEDRRRVADEVDPELAGDLGDLRRRPEREKYFSRFLKVEERHYEQLSLKGKTENKPGQSRASGFIEWTAGRQGPLLPARAGR